MVYRPGVGSPSLGVVGIRFWPVCYDRLRKRLLYRAVTICVSTTVSGREETVARGC